VAPQQRLTPACPVTTFPLSLNRRADRQDGAQDFTLKVLQSTKTRPPSTTSILPVLPVNTAYGLHVQCLLGLPSGAPRLSLTSHCPDFPNFVLNPSFSPSPYLVAPDGFFCSPRTFFTQQIRQRPTPKKVFFSFPQREILSFLTVLELNTRHNRIASLESFTFPVASFTPISAPRAHFPPDHEYLSHTRTPSQCLTTIAPTMTSLLRGQTVIVSGSRHLHFIVPVLASLRQCLGGDTA